MSIIVEFRENSSAGSKVTACRKMGEWQSLCPNHRGLWNPTYSRSCSSLQRNFEIWQTNQTTAICISGFKTSHSICCSWCSHIRWKSSILKIHADRSSVYERRGPWLANCCSKMEWGFKWAKYLLQGICQIYSVNTFTYKLNSLLSTWNHITRHGPLHWMPNTQEWAPMVLERNLTTWFGIQHDLLMHLLYPNTPPPVVLFQPWDWLTLQITMSLL